MSLTLHLNFYSLQVVTTADDDLQGSNAFSKGNKLEFDINEFKEDHRRFARQATTKKVTTTTNKATATTKKATATTKKATGTTKKATTAKATTKKANLVNAVNYS